VTNKKTRVIKNSRIPKENSAVAIGITTKEFYSLSLSLLPSLSLPPSLSLSIPPYLSLSLSLSLYIYIYIYKTIKYRVILVIASKL